MDETTAKKCPYCQLINPKSAQRCDCGFEFGGYIVSPQEHELGKKLRKMTGYKWISSGIVSIILGITLTRIISLGTSKAGFTVFFWGLIVAGLVGIFRGVMMILGIR